MARYFKLVEIDRDSFVAAVGEDLDCLQLSSLQDGIIYTAIEDSESEIEIDLTLLEEAEE